MGVWWFFLIIGELRRIHLWILLNCVSDVNAGESQRSVLLKYHEWSVTAAVRVWRTFVEYFWIFRWHRVWWLGGGVLLDLCRRNYPNTSNHEFVLQDIRSSGCMWKFWILISRNKWSKLEKSVIPLWIIKTNQQNVRWKMLVWK